MSFKEHENDIITKENDKITNYLRNIIQRYFQIEDEISKETKEDIIIQAYTRLKEIFNAYTKDIIININGKSGAIDLSIKDFYGEEKFNKNTAFNKDFCDTITESKILYDGTNEEYTKYGESQEDKIVEGDDDRLSDARIPLAHTHSIEEVKGLKEFIDSFEILNGGIHTHKNTYNKRINITVLNALIYTGSRTSIDLILLEDLKAKAEKYNDMLLNINREVTNTGKRYLNSLTDITDEIERNIQYASDNIDTWLTEWIPGYQADVDNSLLALKGQIKHFLNPYLSKTEFNILKKRIEYSIRRFESSQTVSGTLPFVNPDIETYSTDIYSRYYNIDSNVFIYPHKVLYSHKKGYTALKFRNRISLNALPTGLANELITRTQKVNDTSQKVYLEYTKDGVNYSDRLPHIYKISESDCIYAHFTTENFDDTVSDGSVNGNKVLLDRIVSLPIYLEHPLAIGARPTTSTGRKGLSSFLVIDKNDTDYVEMSNLIFLDRKTTLTRYSRLYLNFYNNTENLVKTDKEYLNERLGSASVDDSGFSIWSWIPNPYLDWVDSYVYIYYSKPGGGYCSTPVSNEYLKITWQTNSAFDCDLPIRFYKQCGSNGAFDTIFSSHRFDSVTNFEKDLYNNGYVEECPGEKSLGLYTINSSTGKKECNPVNYNRITKTNSNFVLNAKNYLTTSSDSYKLNNIKFYSPFQVTFNGPYSTKRAILMFKATSRYVGNFQVSMTEKNLKCIDFYKLKNGVSYIDGYNDFINNNINNTNWEIALDNTGAGMSAEVSGGAYNITYPDDCLFENGKVYVIVAKEYTNRADDTKDFSYAFYASNNTNLAVNVFQQLNANNITSKVNYGCYRFRTTLSVTDNINTSPSEKIGIILGTCIVDTNLSASTDEIVQYNELTVPGSRYTGMGTNIVHYLSLLYCFKTGILELVLDYDTAWEKVIDSYFVGTTSDTFTSNNKINIEVLKDLKQILVYCSDVYTTTLTADDISDGLETYEKYDRDYTSSTACFHYTLDELNDRIDNIFSVHSSNVPNSGGVYRADVVNRDNLVLGNFKYSEVGFCNHSQKSGIYVGTDFQTYISNYKSINTRKNGHTTHENDETIGYQDDPNTVLNYCGSLTSIKAKCLSHNRLNEEYEITYSIPTEIGIDYNYMAEVTPGIIWTDENFINDLNFYGSIDNVLDNVNEVHWYNSSKSTMMNADFGNQNGYANITNNLQLSLEKNIKTDMGTFIKELEDVDETNNFFYGSPDDVASKTETIISDNTVDYKRILVTNLAITRQNINSDYYYNDKLVFCNSNFLPEKYTNIIDKTNGYCELLEITSSNNAYCKRNVLPQIDKEHNIFHIKNISSTGFYDFDKDNITDPTEYETKVYDDTGVLIDTIPYINNTDGFYGIFNYGNLNEYLPDLKVRRQIFIIPGKGNDDDYFA